MIAPFPIPKKVTEYGLSIETKKSCDFQSCEQMRDSGWSEKEIELFMISHKSYYDKNYKVKPKTKSRITFPGQKKRWFEFFKL